MMNNSIQSKYAVAGLLVALCFSFSCESMHRGATKNGINVSSELSKELKACETP